MSTPAIEVVDSRIENWQISLVDTVADNASCGFYVVGSRPVALRDFDIRTVAMSLSINGAEVSSGTGADLMKRIAAPMVGGLVTSFVLELLVYPAVYFLWKRKEVRALSTQQVPLSPAPA